MTDIATASVVLAGLVLAVATLLGLGEYRDRRGRAADLGVEDRRHYRLRDRRRALGIAILVALAAGLVIGSRLPSRVNGRANPQFLATWLAIFLLILGLLTLALIDWVALRLFARRHRDRIHRERVELLRDRGRPARPSGGANGQTNGAMGDLFP